MRKMLVTAALVGAVLATAADDLPYLNDSLQIWLRADRGVETNAEGMVTAWRNQGKLGTSADVLSVVNGTEGGVAFSPNGFGNQATLVFDGVEYLRSTGNVSYGISASGGAWFVVLDPETNLNHRVNRAILGSSPGGARFGAFYRNPQNADNGKIIDCYVYGPNAPTVTDPMTRPQVLGGLGWKNAAGQCCTCAVQNWNVSSTVIGGAAPGAGLFHVAHMGISWMSPFVGKIAEIRLYNRPLTRRECLRVQFELCTRYGILWEGHGYVENAARNLYMNGDFLEPRTDTGAVDAESDGASLKVGGLVATLGTPSAMGKDASCYLTHTDEVGLVRQWFLSTWTKVRQGSAVTLSFDISELPETEYELYSRSGDVWTVRAEAGVREGNRLSFQIPAGTWQNGWWRLMPKGGNDALAAWFRADAGLVTNAAGEVQTWRNIGVLGSSIDVFPTNRADASHVMLNATGANGRPSAHFNGGGYLISDGTATLMQNAAQAADCCGIWLVVFKPCADRLARRNMAPFGLPNPSNPSWRGSPFFVHGENGLKMSAYYYSSSCVTTPIEDDWQIMDCVRTGNSLEVFLNGQSRGTVGVNETGWASPLYIGQFGISWATPFEGDIAELRLYRSGINPNDRGLLEVSLGARYGIAVSTAGIDGVPPAAFQLDARMIGGKWGTTVTNATSGELSVSYATEAAVTTSSLTYLAHDDGAWFAADTRPNGNAARSWYLSTALPESSFRFTFRSVDVPLCEYHLLYRATAEEAWRRVAKAPKDVGPVFELASPAKGFYTLEVRPAGMSLIIR